MFAKSAVIALFAAVAAAQLHAPVGDPEGNPITLPKLGDIVVAGVPTTIQWTPTTTNTVSLVFLIDAPLNAHQAGPAIAEGIPNSGSISWTPSGEYGSGDLGFGIQIIDDVTGQYQYSVNFGLSIPDDYETTPSPTPSGYPVSTPSSSQGYPTKPTPSANSTSEYPTKAETTSYVAPTGIYPSGNSSVIYPTGSLTVPTSLKTTATGGPSGTSSPPPESTGAAAQLKVGLGMVAGVAGLFFML